MKSTKSEFIDKINSIITDVEHLYEMFCDNIDNIEDFYKEDNYTGERISYPTFFEELIERINNLKKDY